MKKTSLSLARELHLSLLSAEPAQQSAIIRTFLRGLARKRKGHLRSRIFAAFRTIALASEGRRAGKITTAVAPDRSLLAHTEKMFTNVVFEQAIDPSVLGGAIVQVEDLQVDATVRAQINALKKTLAHSA
jgi:F0F1-type ATP synthase delta subunit